MLWSLDVYPLENGLARIGGSLARAKRQSLRAPDAWQRRRLGNSEIVPDDLGTPPIRYGLLQDFDYLNKNELVGFDAWHARAFRFVTATFACSLCRRARALLFPSRDVFPFWRPSSLTTAPANPVVRRRKRCMQVKKKRTFRFSIPTVAESMLRWSCQSS